MRRNQDLEKVTPRVMQIVRELRRVPSTTSWPGCRGSEPPMRRWSLQKRSWKLRGSDWSPGDDRGGGLTAGSLRGDQCVGSIMRCGSTLTASGTPCRNRVSADAATCAAGHLVL